MAKKEKEYSPSDKARHFTLGSIARVGACIYLIYIIYTLIKGASSGDMDVPKPVLIMIVALFSIIGAYLIYVTVREVIRGIKNKEYSMHKYYQDELTAQGLKLNSRGELVPIDTPDDEEEEEDDEEYDDEEYDDDDDEEYDEDESEDYEDESEEDAVSDEE